MPWLYILYSEKDDKFYTGQTERDIQTRCADHQNGYVKATKFRRPVTLAYAKEFATGLEAKKKEWELKQPSGYTEKRLLLEELRNTRDRWPIIEYV